MKRTQHNRPIDAGDLQTRASKLIKLNDKVYLMSGYKNIDKYQVQRMRVAYMEESIPIMQKAALTRLRYGESSKIKKRDLKLIEKELNLSKA